MYCRLSYLCFFISVIKRELVGYSCTSTNEEKMEIPAMPCHEVTCHEVTCYVVPYHVPSYHVAPCHVAPCHIIPYHLVPCCSLMPCSLMPCSTMPCIAKSCHLHQHSYLCHLWNKFKEKIMVGLTGLDSCFQKNPISALFDLESERKCNGEKKKLLIFNRLSTKVGSLRRCRVGSKQGSGSDKAHA